MTNDHVPQPGPGIIQSSSRILGRHDNDAGDLLQWVGYIWRFGDSNNGSALAARSKKPRLRQVRPAAPISLSSFRVVCKYLKFQSWRVLFVSGIRPLAEGSIAGSGNSSAFPWRDGLL